MTCHLFRILRERCLGVRLRRVRSRIGWGRCGLGIGKDGNVDGVYADTGRILRCSRQRIFQVLYKYNSGFWRFATYTDGGELDENRKVISAESEYDYVLKVSL